MLRCTKATDEAAHGFSLRECRSASPSSRSALPDFRFAELVPSLAGPFPVPLRHKVSDPRARVADKLGGRNKKQGVRFVFVLIVNVIYRTLLEGVWLIEFGR